MAKKDGPGACLDGARLIPMQDNHVVENVGRGRNWTEDRGLIVVAEGGHIVYMFRVSVDTGEDRRG